MNKPPKAFLSHASEDKSLFVKPVAEHLRALGIEAWLDEWEIKPGDSLIQKIFSEGIAASDAVVIFVSDSSVTKKWVSKELSVSAVENISKNLRLIPVRLDEADVPTVLKDQLWLDWNQSGGALGVAQAIAKTMFNIDSKPDVGTPPPFLEDGFSTPLGLLPSDQAVLRAIVKLAIDSGRHNIWKEPILEQLGHSGLSESDVLESCQALIQKGYVWDKRSNFYQGIVQIEVPAATVLDIAQDLGYDINSLQIQMASMILNLNDSDCELLSQKLSIPTHLVEALADDFSDNGFLRVAHYIGSPAKIHSPNALFNRWLLERTR